MAKQMPPWLTKLLTLLLAGATYVVNHKGLLPAWEWHGVSLLGVASGVIFVYGVLGLSGPSVSAKVSAALGNPGAPAATPAVKP